MNPYTADSIDNNSLTQYFVVLMICNTTPLEGRGAKPEPLG